MSFMVAFSLGEIGLLAVRRVLSTEELLLQSLVTEADTFNPALSCLVFPDFF